MPSSQTSWVQGIRNEDFGWYQTIKSELSERSLAHWESHQDILQRGILHSGRLELFWNKMREDVFETFVSEDSLYKFIASRDLSEQWINFEPFFLRRRFLHCIQRIYR